MPDENLESLFRTWLIEHQGAVLKVARAYTLTLEDCQDLVQEILLQVWMSLPQFQGKSSASTWFYRVALNTALSWHRQEHRRRGRHHAAIEIADVPATSPENSDQLVQRETVERLYTALRQLPKTDAAVVLLYLEDMTYRQIAEVLGISETHVGVKLNRAKKALSELLKDESHES